MHLDLTRIKQQTSGKEKKHKSYETIVLIMIVLTYAKCTHLDSAVKSALNLKSCRLEELRDWIERTEDFEATSCHLTNTWLMTRKLQCE